MVYIDLVAAEANLLVGHILDADGQGLGRGQIRMHFEAKDYSNPHFRLETASDSRFRFELDDRFLGVELENIVLQQIVGMDYNAPWVATIDRPVTLDQGRNDLGEIRLRALPRLASGRVRIDGAPPKQHPSLEFEEHDGNDWVPTRTAVVTWGEDGRFEALGLPGPGRHRVLVKHRQCLALDPITFRPEARDLVIDLVRGGSVKASFLLDDREHGKHLLPALTPMGSPAQRPLTFRREMEEERASFAWSGLPPGDYHLQLQLPGSKKPIVDFDHLTVPAGGPCTDSRLTVDLRGRARLITIRVVRPDSKPVLQTPGVIWSGTGANRPGVFLAGESAELLITGAADLFIAVKGYTVRSLNAVDDDRTVRLESWPTVALRLPDVELPDGVRLTIRSVGSDHPLDSCTIRIPSMDRLWRSRDYTRPTSRFSLGTGRTVQIPVRIGGACNLRVWMNHRASHHDLTGYTPTRLTDKTKDAQLIIPDKVLKAAERAVGR